MNLENKKTIYQVYLGTKLEGALCNTTIAGHCVAYEGDNHYVLHLMMIPNVSYYLGKNPTAKSTYTVFTKCFWVDGKLRFQNPVGTARLTDDLKTHLEIEFPLLKTCVYMNLFPKVFKKEA